MQHQWESVLTAPHTEYHNTYIDRWEIKDKNLNKWVDIMKDCLYFNAESFWKSLLHYYSLMSSCHSTLLHCYWHPKTLNRATPLHWATYFVSTLNMSSAVYSWTTLWPRFWYLESSSMSGKCHWACSARIYHWMQPYVFVCVFEMYGKHK